MAWLLGFILLHSAIAQACQSQCDQQSLIQLSTGAGSKNFDARGTSSIPDWLLSECYPGTEGQKMWEVRAEELKACAPGLTEQQIEYLGKSQFFCPAIRGNQNTSLINSQGGCRNNKDNTDQDCTYINGTIKETATAAGAPGLLAHQGQMRYADPIYFYNAHESLAKGNPPTNPFINVNKMYADEGGRFIWAGQCPLSDTETHLKKASNVCSWLQFLKEQDIEMLVSLSPSHAEVEAGKVKAKCQDYILTRAGMDAQGDRVCDGKDYSMKELETKHWTVEDRTGSVFGREVTFDGFTFTQLYFDGWPDAHGEASPPVPPPAAIEFIINEASEKNRVAVHCAGGRGRTGTVVSGVVSTWAHAEVNAQVLADTVVQLRETRADIVEHPSQFMLLGQVFKLPADQNSCPLNVQVG